MDMYFTVHFMAQILNFVPLCEPNSTAVLGRTAFVTLFPRNYWIRPFGHRNKTYQRIQTFHDVLLKIVVPTKWRPLVL
jgi:hypothetical protein